MPLTRPSIDFIEVDTDHADTSNDGSIVVYSNSFALESQQEAVKDTQVTNIAYDSQSGTLTVILNDGTILKAHGFPTADTLTAGEDGYRGPPGADGISGKDAINGLAGEAGCAGPIGPDGNRGEKGPRGDSGSKGSRGDTGIRGQDGPRGSPGSRGDIGPKGAPGNDGIKGADAEVRVFISNNDPGTAAGPGCLWFCPSGACWTMQTTVRPTCPPTYAPTYAPTYPPTNPPTNSPTYPPTNPPTGNTMCNLSVNAHDFYLPYTGNSESALRLNITLSDQSCAWEIEKIDAETVYDSDGMRTDIGTGHAVNNSIGFAHSRIASGGGKVGSQEVIFYTASYDYDANDPFTVTWHIYPIDNPSAYQIVRLHVAGNTTVSPACGITAVPNIISVNAAQNSGSGIIQVTVPNGCTWSANPPTWSDSSGDLTNLHYKANNTNRTSAGTGPGTLQVVVLDGPYTGPATIGSFTITTGDGHSASCEVHLAAS